MKTKKNDLDIVFYTLACWITFGAVWAIRLAISVGIRKALEDK